jgi:hypothetical protein
MDRRRAQIALKHGGRPDRRLRVALMDSVADKFRVPSTSMKNSIAALLTEPRLTATQLDELFRAIDEVAGRVSRLAVDAVYARRVR